MSDKLRSYLYLHFCVMVWGFTAILGKLISLKALPLVWWRVMICSVVLGLALPAAQIKDVSGPMLRRLLFIGALVGLHWLCFYEAVKLSNASVAVASMAATSFFSSLVEPWLLRQRVKWYEVGLGLLILPGIALIVGYIDWTMRPGFVVGASGALLAAIFSVLNKKVVDNSPPPPFVMSFIELSGAFLISSAALPFVLYDSPAALIPRGNDWLWLGILSIVCTLLPYSLTLKAMRHISAFGANLTINLEPVYGVLLAAALFREDKDLDPGFYFGVGIILVAVFSHPFLKYFIEKQRRQPA